MKKLGKKLDTAKETLEAYACFCSCACGTCTSCNCYLIAGNAEATAEKSMRTWTTQNSSTMGTPMNG